MSAHDSLVHLFQRLQVRQHVVHVGIGVFRQLRDVRLRADRLTVNFTWLVGQERYQPVASVSAIVNSSRYASLPVTVSFGRQRDRRDRGRRRRAAAPASARIEHALQQREPLQACRRGRRNPPSANGTSRSHRRR